MNAPNPGKGYRLLRFTEHIKIDPPDHVNFYDDGRKSWMGWRKTENESKIPYSRTDFYLGLAYRRKLKTKAKHGRTKAH